MNGTIDDLNNIIDDLKELVIDAADDHNGAYLDYPRAFAYAIGLIEAKATSLNVTYLDQQALTHSSSTEINKMICVVQSCIADQQI